jgi:hypothetical protein
LAYRFVYFVWLAGIGKSVLMGYFFQRYSEMYPETTIKFVSFNKESVLRESAVARGGKVVKVVQHDPDGSVETIVYDEAELTKASKDAVWLLDGPPKSIPARNYRWVSFTSPNEAWEKKL